MICPAVLLTLCFLFALQNLHRQLTFLREADGFIDTRSKSLLGAAACTGIQGWDELVNRKITRLYWILLVALLLYLSLFYCEVT